MAMIKGITVTLYEKEKINEDPFGKLIYKETPTKVENVLVASTNTQEVLDALNLTGKKAVYTIAIPKGDKHTWKDNKVEFFWRNLESNRISAAGNRTKYTAGMESKVDGRAIWVRKRKLS